LAFSLLQAAGSAATPAADWPQYRGPGRDGQAPGVTLPKAWPKKLKTRWKIRLGGGFSSPAVATGTIQWTGPRLGKSRAGMLLADGKLLIYTDGGDLVVADASHEAYRERARFSVAGHTWVPPVLADDGLFLRDATSLQCLEWAAGKE
jgi:hypothetical protein